MIMDLMRFGKDDKGAERKKIFVEKVKGLFKQIVLIDTENNKVFVDLSYQHDEFYNWLIAYDWDKFSFGLELIKKGQPKLYNQYMERALIAYPELLTIKKKKI